MYFNLSYWRCFRWLSSFYTFCPPSWKWRPYWIFQSRSIAKINLYIILSKSEKSHASIIKPTLIITICTNLQHYIQLYMLYQLTHPIKVTIWCFSYLNQTLNFIVNFIYSLWYTWKYRILIKSWKILLNIEYWVDKMKFFITL